MTDVYPMTITEVEPGLFEMRFTHGDHEHAMRAMRTVLGDQHELLESSYRATLMLIARGEADCQADAANKPW